MKINEFFDKIYCINLDHRPDRWETAQKEFDKIGVTEYIERWPGVVNDDGNLGCTLSHVSIMKDAKENNYKRILIFEDDVLFVQTDVNKIESALDDLEELGNWDLFYIGSTVEPKTGRFDRVTDNLLRTNFAYTTHAYGVNQQVYDETIRVWEENIQRGHTIVDTTLCTEIVKKRKKSFVLDPIYAIQQPGHSDINNYNVATYEWMVTYFNNVKEISGV